MPALMFLTSSWRSRTGGRPVAMAVQPAPRPAPAAVVETADDIVRPKPDDAMRPLLRRPRRYRSDGVLGLRWLG